SPAPCRGWAAAPGWEPGMSGQASAAGSRGLPAETADVIVVGAGPAGSSAALRLAQAGPGGLVFEEARFPRGEVGGGGLTPPAGGEGAGRDGDTDGGGRWLAADQRSADGRRRGQARGGLAGAVQLSRLRHGPRQAGLR